MKPFNENKKIKSEHDFNQYVSDMFTEFLDPMEGNQEFTREACEDDPEDAYDLRFMYTDKACDLIIRFRKRIIEVGEAHFPGGNITCESHLFIEV